MEESDIANEKCISFSFHKLLQKQESLDLYTKLHKKKERFLDVTFPCDKISLFGGSFPPGYNGEWEGIQWKSPRDIDNGKIELFGDLVKANINVGYLTDYYFLSTIAILLSKDPEIIKRIFTVQKVNDVGVYGVWLNINGGWQEVTIDDKFPVFVDSENNTIQYTFSQTYQPTI